MVPSRPCHVLKIRHGDGKCRPFPIGACLGEPVKEFGPRSVRNNIGDTQSLFVLR